MADHQTGNGPSAPASAAYPEEPDRRPEEVGAAEPEEAVAVGDGAGPAETPVSGSTGPAEPAGAQERFSGSDSFGLWLRRQREIREIDLREISDRTKISLRYLKAIEADRFEILPGPVFLKGFLREYARYVGLDPDEVVNYYLSTQEVEPEPEIEEDPLRGERRSRLWSLLFYLLLAAALVAALWYGYGYLEERQSRQAPEPPPMTAPVAPQPGEEPSETVPAGTEERRAPLVVTVDFLQDCWVEMVVDGIDRRSAQYAQGESVTIEAEESVVFEILGNAGGVNLEVNDLPFPLGAEPGEVMRDVRIDLETARRLESQSQT